MTLVPVVCPHCGRELTVEEHTYTYAIKDGAVAVESCPQCGVELLYRDGKLVDV
jgi:predicted RNA-binding Zn-ribbon protein involved in translation (DUF1610 family)